MTPSSGKPLTILTTWAGCLYVIPSVHLQLRSCNCTHHPRKLHVKPWFLDVYHPKNKTHPWHPAQKSWVEPASALAISSLALIFNFCSNAWTGATIYQFGCLNLETPVITFAQMVVATNFGVQLDSKNTWDAMRHFGDLMILEVISCQPIYRFEIIIKMIELQFELQRCFWGRRGNK